MKKKSGDLIGQSVSHYTPVLERTKKNQRAEEVTPVVGQTYEVQPCDNPGTVGGMAGLVRPQVMTPQGLIPSFPCRLL